MRISLPDLPLLRCFRIPARLPAVQQRLGPLCSIGLLVALPLLDPRLPIRQGRQQALIQPRGGSPSELAMLQSYRSADEAGVPYRITPERRALLNTIRYAEGTWVGGSAEGYRMLYGGGRFASLDRHPDLVVRSGYSSAAAGAYQFLPATWKEAASRLKLVDFGPVSQDQAALYLVEKRGALRSFDREGLTGEVLARLAPEWASLPTHRGESHYGQPVKGAAELRNFYEAELTRQRSLAA